MPADHIGCLGFPKKGMTMDINAALPLWVPSLVQEVVRRILDRMGAEVAIATTLVRYAL